jgi:hypothetical protein
MPHFRTQNFESKDKKQIPSSKANQTAKICFFFEIGSIAPASASIDAHGHFIAIFKVSAIYKSWIT